MDMTLIGWAVTGIFAVLWWLLKQKDEKREQEIQHLTKDFEDYKTTARELLERRLDTIWTKHRDDTASLTAKHEADVKELADLKERIAREHYVKHELDAKFDKLEKTIYEGFRELGGEFRNLRDALLAHTVDKP